MAKRKDQNETETAQAQPGQDPQATEGAARPEGEGAQFPPRANNEASPLVISIAQTISGCTDSEVKQFVACMDLAIREVLLHHADKWKKICRNAEAMHKEGEAAAKISTTTKFAFDFTNIQMLDLKVKTTVPGVKYTTESVHKEDLRQVEFNLGLTSGQN